MKVYDMLNNKWYHKGKLIKESYDVFIKEANRDPGLETKKDKHDYAMDLAREYVRENTLSTLREVNEWRKNNE
jgi:hypothetical protein